MPSTVPVSDLTEHTGFWLRMVSNHVSHSFASRLAEKDVTVAEWCLLRVLYDAEPTAPSKAADEMGMTRGAITKLAGRLIAKGLIVREASDSDGRAQTLALTERGNRLLPELAALADHNDAECFDCLTRSERETLRVILKKLAAGSHMTIPLD